MIIDGNSELFLAKYKLIPLKSPSTGITFQDHIDFMTRRVTQTDLTHRGNGELWVNVYRCIYTIGLIYTYMCCV